MNLQYAVVNMIKFMTRVKNITAKQTFVLSEQTRKMKQTTPINTRKRPLQQATVLANKPHQLFAFDTGT